LHKNIKTIIVKKDVLIINEQNLNSKELNVFNSKINFLEELNETILNNICSIIEENISMLNVLSLAFLINPEFEDAFETRFEKAFIKHIKLAWAKIYKGDLIDGVKKIKGSGVGLTPSGDDFITGMLYALFLLEKIDKKSRSKQRNEIYDASKSNNNISRNMIFHASKGLYFKQFKDLKI